MILTVIIFLVILALLVFIHELGHFIAAKISGVRVDEFSIGFPPRIFEKTFGETKYSIGCVPFGGYVKIFGEDGEEGDRAFTKKSRLIQVFILISGIIGNIILGWLLFSIALMSGLTLSAGDAPMQYMSNERVTITEVLPNSPASKIGIVSNETIVSINSKIPNSIDGVQNIIANSNGSPISLVVKDSSNQIKNISIIPEKGIIGNDYGIGVALDQVGEAYLPPFLALYDGARLTKNTIENIVSGFGQIITDGFKGQNDLSDVSGPVGIARLVGQAEHIGFAYLLSFTAFISLNLAIINLVPFPALDGGRILFVAIEAIRRKNISAKVTNIVNSVGFGILILLLIVVTIKDIWNIF